MRAPAYETFYLHNKSLREVWKWYYEPWQPFEHLNEGITGF